jgi:hypothetical protein
MKRKHRLLIELLVPPLLAGVLYSIGDLFISPFEWLSIVSFYIFAAFVYGGLPTIAYAVLLELCFSRGVQPGSKIALAVSAGLGALAAPSSVLIAAGGHVEVLAPSSFLLFPFLGATAGSVVWVLIGRIDREERPKQPVSQQRRADAPRCG